MGVSRVRGLFYNYARTRGLKRQLYLNSWMIGKAGCWVLRCMRPSKVGFTMWPVDCDAPHSIQWCLATEWTRWTGWICHHTVLWKDLVKKTLARLLSHMSVALTNKQVGHYVYTCKDIHLLKGKVWGLRGKNNSNGVFLHYTCFCLALWELQILQTNRDSFGMRQGE